MKGKFHFVSLPGIIVLIALVAVGFYRNNEITGGDSKDLAFQYLNESMDEFHEAFDVYTDLSAAGNHFVALGKMSSVGDEDKVEINPGSDVDPYSGSTCIENRFYASGDNWGGWYFMNGVLEGEETQPKPNWGNYPDAGVNLIGATELTFWVRGKEGGERVEFFAFGIGRDSETGDPIEPYPDSSPKVSLGSVTLPNSWAQYNIDLTGNDLSYVLGGFGWITKALENNSQDITFYLDDIRYNKSHLEELRFLVSYETIPSSLDFDTIMKNVAFTYDNALVLIALLSEDTEYNMQRAKLLADALVYAVDNDRYFNDGRLRNAYQGGDLVLFPGWKPNGKDDTIRMAGWWDPSGNFWYEDEEQVSTHTGNLAWAIIAVLSYYEKVGGSQYLDAAVILGEWIESETRDSRGAGGYTGGYQGWEMTSINPDGQTKILWKSTEHNIDVYVAFKRLYEETGVSDWEERALHAKAFVEAMWDEMEGHFWTGNLEDGVTINTSTVPADVNTWGLMALDDIEKYTRGITWVENNCYVEVDGFMGFDFNDDRDHIWFEGTAHMVLAYQIMGDTINANIYLSELERSQTEAPNNNGKGIVAASHDGLTTGFHWLYYARPHIGATAWFIFAKNNYNPYWATTIIREPDITADPISHDFGSLDVGSSSPAQTFILTNSGNADLVIDTLSIIDTNSTDFSMQNDSCSGQIMTPSDICSVDVIFSPSSESSKSASLSIQSNDPDTPTLNILLSGTGTVEDDKVCFIATATYGSAFHSYVRILRGFRDKYLMPYKLGCTFVRFYYKYSPVIADLIAEHNVLKIAVWISLLPLVAFSYSMIHFGPVITTVMLILIFVLPIFLTSFFRRKLRGVEAKDPKALASRN